MGQMKKIVFLFLILPLFTNVNDAYIQRSEAFQKFVYDHKGQSHLVLEIPLFNLPRIPTLDIIFATGTNTINTPLSPMTREMTFSDATHLLS